MQNSSPSVHWLKTKRMSKAVGSAASTLAISSAPKPWPTSAVGLISGAPSSVPWPTAWATISSTSAAP